MKNLIKIFGKYKRKYKFLVKVNINQANLIHNFNYFKNLNKGLKVAPVLKSNAYGHDLVNIAKILEPVISEFICVDSYYEALILRNYGVNSKLLILGYTITENIFKNKFKNVVFTISDIKQLFEILANISKKIEFHIKINTGMNRQGFDINIVDEVICKIVNNKKIVLSGVYSHLADADSESVDFTNKQIDAWHEIVEMIKNKIPSVEYFHLAGTEGSLNTKIKPIKANICRIGLGLFGYSVNSCFDLKPVLSMNTIVTSIKQVKRGDKIGYNGIYEVKEDMKIATIPVGYYEGLDRRLSGKGCVYINNKKCLILGKISMNMATIDVSDLLDIKTGDKVEVIGENKGKMNSIESMANISHTIPYDILVKIPSNLRRKVV